MPQNRDQERELRFSTKSMQLLHGKYEVKHGLCFPGATKFPFKKVLMSEDA